MKVVSQWSHSLKNIVVQRHKSIHLSNPSLFLKRIGELLNEGYTISEAIHLVLPFHTERYKEATDEIQLLLKRGEGIASIFNALGFSNQLLVSLYVAEKSGDVAFCLMHNAQYLTAVEKTKKKMKDLLTYPLILFVFLSGIMFGFRKYFLPNLMAMQTSHTNEPSLMMKLLPNLAVRLPDILIAILVVITLGIIAAMFTYRVISPNRKILFISRLPVFNRYFFIWKTQQLTLELGNLLNGGFTVQDGLEVLSRQKNDVLLQEIAIQLQYFVCRGEPFYAAVQLLTFLPKQFSIYVQHGEVSGHLGKELMIYSENLMSYLENRMTRSLQVIQPLMFIVIACCIIAAYLALLLPMYQMIDTI